LFACDEDGESKLSRLNKDRYRVEYKPVSDRSYKQLAMFFAVVKRIYETTVAQDLFSDAEELREAMLIEAKHRRRIFRLDGKSWYWVAKSISYKEADHNKFQAIFDAAIDAACLQWDLDRQELLEGR